MLSEKLTLLYKPSDSCTGPRCGWSGARFATAFCAGWTALATASELISAS